jgi:hypothetical protein
LSEDVDMDQEYGDDSDEDIWLEEEEFVSE